MLKCSGNLLSNLGNELSNVHFLVNAVHASVQTFLTAEPRCGAPHLPQGPFSCGEAITSLPSLLPQSLPRPRPGYSALANIRHAGTMTQAMVLALSLMWIWSSCSCSAPALVTPTPPPWLRRLRAPREYPSSVFRPESDASVCLRSNVAGREAGDRLVPLSRRAWIRASVRDVIQEPVVTRAPAFCRVFTCQTAGARTRSAGLRCI
ncbi:hypothetical protein BD626DRAFT_3143 [Schizophyllum amplum]|uniref:Uncharacterized protein n=1 Tax=Schizophyllum amplum TaxID=97359 RepID=A0A550CVW6_9AGAR|nr:hypothetical protein BD626DRAFT_3143 [Auriculariopsis ampla]